MSEEIYESHMCTRLNGNSNNAEIEGGNVMTIVNSHVPK